MQNIVNLIFDLILVNVFKGVYMHIIILFLLFLMPKLVLGMEEAKDSDDKGIDSCSAVVAPFEGNIDQLTRVVANRRLLGGCVVEPEFPPIFLPSVVFTLADTNFGTPLVPYGDALTALTFMLFPYPNQSPLKKS